MALGHKIRCYYYKAKSWQEMKKRTRAFNLISVKLTFETSLLSCP